MVNDWKIMHGNVIRNFLLYLNSVNNCYVLKGGTALMFCYNLSRFSEDIDLDAIQSTKAIAEIVKTFCLRNGFEYRVAKDTNTVRRYMIHYGSQKPLKVEVSYRRKGISESEYSRVNGVFVYNIDRLLSFKLQAYMGRDKLRDLYDVVFICKHYWSYIPEPVRLNVKDILSFKGLEHFDYIVSTQHDSLIDVNILANDFLALYNHLGLL